MRSFNNPRLRELRAASAEKRHGKPRYCKPDASA